MTDKRFSKAPRRSRLPVLLGCAVVLGGAWTCSLAQVPQDDFLPSGETACGSLDNGNAGPYDYRDGREYVRRQLNLVNQNHFSYGVRTLKGGQTSVYVLGDLDFVLRHFPNHHAALQTMSKYFLQGGSPLQFRSAECYFDRAMRFAPDDLQVRLLFAIYLQRTGRLRDAIQQMERALEITAEPSMELHYNIALLYVDAKDFEKANYHASVAYAMGHPLPGLREKLQRLGEWRPVRIPKEGTQPETTASSASTSP